MKAGFWILIGVIIAGIVVGGVLKKNLDKGISRAFEQKLAAAEKIEDVDARLVAFKRLIAEDPPDRLKRRVYRKIAATMLSAKADTSGFVRFAWDALESERGPGSRSELFYFIYTTGVEDENEIAKKLLELDRMESWIYNYIAYEFFERGENLEVALSLAEKAIELAESKTDSAMYLDTRGAIYLKMGSYSKALPDLVKAAGLLDEPDVEILRHLAQAYIASGDKEKAFETYRSILLLGEYDFARSAIDSLMDLRGLSPAERDRFERELWEERISSAKTFEPFTLRSAEGEDYQFKLPASEVTLIALMSPT